MNVQQIRSFVAVVDHGTFSEAARVLGISQPAVTMQVQALETDVGATLLDRHYRRIDLTEAGRTLLPHARRVLEQIEAAHEEISALSDVVTGHIIIAASTTPGVYVIPRLLGAFVADNPEVTVTIMVADSARVVEAVENGEAHIGMTGAVLRGARVEYEEVGRDELLLIGPVGRETHGEDPLTLAGLSDEPWIMREQGSGTRQVTESLLSTHGVDPEELRVVVELGTGEAIVSAVEGGLGYAIISSHVADKAVRLGTVASVHVTGLPAVRPYYVVSPRGTLTRAARAFHEHLIAALG